MVYSLMFKFLTILSSLFYMVLYMSLFLYILMYLSSVPNTTVEEMVVTPVYIFISLS